MTGLITVPGQHPDFPGAVIVGGFVYSSGLIAPTVLCGQNPIPDFDEQVHEVIGYLETLLARAGSTLNLAVRVEAFLADPAHLNRWHDAFTQTWPHHRPARSTLLARPLIPGAHIEIQTVAAVRTGRH